MSDIRSQSRGGRYVIFCVGQERERICAFMQYMNDNKLPYKQLEGRYKGQYETSFIVSEDTFSKISHFTIEEESLLYLGEAIYNGARPATLVYGGHERPIGMFRQCFASEAQASDSWTRDPLTGSYYVCT